MVSRFRPACILRHIARIDLIATAALAAFAGLRRLAAPAPFLFVSCQGFVNPNATVGALSRHAAHAGSASALIGLGQFTCGAISGLFVGLPTDHTARGMAALMLIGAAGMTIADNFRARP